MGRASGATKEEPGGGSNLLLARLGTSKKSNSAAVAAFLDTAGVLWCVYVWQVVVGAGVAVYFSVSHFLGTT